MLPTVALAQHDDHGNEQARRGLAQSFPEAKDLSRDPTWRLYAFERDGISYFQVNDMLGVVHVIIAKAGSTFWTLPVGESDAMVSLPSLARGPLPRAVPIEVYRDAEFALRFYNDGANSAWSVEQTY